MAYLKVLPYQVYIYSISGWMHGNVELEHPEIMPMAFADNMVLRGQIGPSEMRSIIDIFSAFGLNINTKKTHSFYCGVANGCGAAKKTFKYLGLRVRANGKSFNTLGVEERLR